MSDKQSALEEISVPRESEVESYYRVRENLEQLRKSFQAFLTRPANILPFMQPGRMVRVSDLNFFELSNQGLVIFT